MPNTCAGAGAPAVLICLRIDDGPPSVPSVAGACSQCRRIVWISDRGRRFLRGLPGSRPVCLRCASAGGTT
jgi:hypothetical protein